MCAVPQPPSDPEEVKVVEDLLFTTTDFGGVRPDGVRRMG